MIDPELTRAAICFLIGIFVFATGLYVSGMALIKLIWERITK